MMMRTHLNGSVLFARTYDRAMLDALSLCGIRAFFLIRIAIEELLLTYLLTYLHIFV